MARAAKKIPAPVSAAPGPAPRPSVTATQTVVDLPVAPEKFQQAFEAYVDARDERDRHEARMKGFAPIIITYVKANGEHGKPMRPDDAKLEYNGFGVHHQFNPRWHDDAGVLWVKQQIEALPPDDPQRDEYERLLVPTLAINRELWESMLERPNSPIPQFVADKVIPISYKLVIRDLAKKTCTCGATVAKAFNFCPKCGTALQEQFENAHRAKG